jgi:hypothetical protein
MGLFRRATAPSRGPDRGGSYGEALLAELHGWFPWLVDVTVGAPGKSGGPMSWGDPMAWPDGGDPRWFYYPGLLPPGTGLPGSQLSPHLFGVNQGRSWNVDFQYLSKADGERRAMARFRTFVRAVSAGSEAGSPPPWALISPPLDAPMFRFARAPTITPRRGIGIYALQQLSLSSVLQARSSPLPVATLPGVELPVVVAASEPRLDSFLRSDAVTASYRGWTSLAGDRTNNPIPILPLLDLHGFRIQSWVPLAPGASPAAVAQAFTDFTQVVASLEAEAPSPPLPSTSQAVALPSPTGAAQDLRPGVLCAGCGQIEIPRNRSDPGTHRFYVETLRCARPIFAPTRSLTT